MYLAIYSNNLLQPSSSSINLDQLSDGKKWISRIFADSDPWNCAAPVSSGPNSVQTMMYNFSVVKDARETFPTSPATHYKSCIWANTNSALFASIDTAGAEQSSLCTAGDLFPSITNLA